MWKSVSEFLSIEVVDKQPYWYLVSKGMTKSSPTIVVSVLLVLVAILFILVIWDRYSRKETEEKIKEINWKKFDSVVKKEKISDYSIKLL